MQLIYTEHFFSPPLSAYATQTGAYGGGNRPGTPPSGRKPGFLTVLAGKVRTAWRRLVDKERSERNQEIAADAYTGHKVGV